MRNMKKFIAVVSAMAMALCPTMVSAADTVTAAPATGGAVGSGEIEDIIDKEVFVAILPTSSETQNKFDIKLDPQELLKETTGAAIGVGATFSDNTGLYFKNGSTNSFSSSSDAVVLETKTSTDCAIKLDVEVELTSAAGVSFATEAAACTGTTKNIYLAVEASNAAILADNASAATKVAVGTDGKASVSTTNAGLPESSFETKYTAGSYTYGLTTAANTAKGSIFEFKLEGACNKEADWKDVKDMEAEVNIVWTIEKGGAATSDTYKLTKNSNGTSSYSFVNAPTGTLTSLVVNGTTRNVAITNGAASYSNGVLSFTSGFTSNYITSSTTIVATIGGKAYTITYTP